MTELRFAPAVAAMEAFLEPHRSWLETVLEGPASEWMRCEVEVPFGQLAASELLAGVSLDRECLAEGDALRPLVTRWAIPPDRSPRIDLLPSRTRRGPMLEQAPAWDPHWAETPVAVWLQGLRRAVVAIAIPYVSFAHGLTHAWQSWLLVHRAEVAPVLNLLGRILGEARTKVKTMLVVGGRDVPLPKTRYDWEDVVLDTHLTRLVRADFESFLQREAWFRCHRLPFRRGYLFHGPPGNGKTSAIRIMASHPAVSAHTLDFSNEELGNEALTAVFDRAGRRAPSLVIFEDLDRLYGARGGGDNRTHITLQHLLNCLDGLGDYDGVIVVATANDPTALDPAILRRPGRFDRIVPFPPPDLALRQEYLRRLSQAPWDEATLAAAARETEGFSFAHLRESYILAGQLAFERGEAEIGAGDLLEGIRLVKAEAHTAGSRIDGKGVGFGLPASRADRPHEVSF